MFCPSMVVFAPSFMNWIRPIGYEGMREAVLLSYHKELHSFVFLKLDSFLNKKYFSFTDTSCVISPNFLNPTLTNQGSSSSLVVSPQKKAENLTTLVLCLMTMCFHVLRHFFSFSLLVKEVPWFKKRERKEIDQAR